MALSFGVKYGCLILSKPISRYASYVRQTHLPQNRQEKQVRPSSLPKMNQAGLGRILGPRGLMPSTKLGTVVDNVGTAIKNMLGGSMYRERQGVVRMAVGQLGFTPEQLRDNVKSFVGQIKKDATNLSDQVTKEVYEVVGCIHPRNISGILTKSFRF
jgi:hypothetical protein